MARKQDKKRKSKQNLATFYRHSKKICSLQQMRVSWSGVRRVTSDRSQWKNLVTQYSGRSGKIRISLSKSVSYIVYVCES